MPDKNQKHEPPASWASVLAGMIVFLIYGLFLIAHEIPPDWPVSNWLRYSNLVLLWCIIALPPIGLCVGWVKGFPRWSYPYLGNVLLQGLYMMSVATPGLRFFNYTFGRNDLWGWRAWIPFLVAAVISLLVTRSLKPIIKLFTKVWKDWTLLTYGMFGFMPMLVWISFDEMDKLFSLPFMIILTLVMVGTVLLYLRSTHQWQRVLILAVGVITVTATAVAVPAVYWRENGWVYVAMATTGGIIIVAFVFLPALVGLLRYSLNRLRPSV